MEIQNLNAKKFLKETPAGEIPADWAAAPLKHISEIHDSRVTPESSPGRIFVTRAGKIYNSRPSGAGSVSITAKKGFGINWIRACLGSERKPFKFTKKHLENHHIPLPPPPELKTAGETLKYLHSLIRKCGSELSKSSSAELREPLRKREYYQGGSKGSPSPDETESYIRLAEYLRSILQKIGPPENRRTAETANNRSIP